MIAETKSIDDILLNYKFKIPLYQRLYCWKRPQCETLFKDFNRLINSENKIPHYFGSIIIEKIDDNSFSIIDGQQRITSLFLLLFALSKKNDNNNLIEFIEKGRLVMQGKSNNFLDDLSSEDSLLKGNLDIFSEMLSDKKYEFNEIKEALNLFQVSWIELERNKEEEKDYPQITFEKMNSEGKDLKEYDLIRNYIFLLAAESKDEEITTVATRQKIIYYNDWKNFEDEFSERRLHRMKDFFRDYLVIKTKNTKITSNANLYEEFKKYLSERFKDQEPTFDDIEILVNELWKYADYWGKVVLGNSFAVIDKENIDRLKKALKEFSMIGSADYYPFILLLIEEYERVDSFNHKKLSETIELINKFILISMITETKVRFKEKTFEIFDDFVKNNLKQALQEKFWANKIPDIKEALTGTTNFNTNNKEDDELGSDIQQSEIIEDDEFDSNKQPEETIEKDLPEIYHSKRKTVCLLLKINEAYVSKVDTQIEFSTSNHSIEHIMPQTPEDDWNYVSDKTHNKYLHTLGNLTLVSKNLNSSLSNKAYKEKEEKYKLSNYAITREIGKFGNWGDSEIAPANNFRKDIALKLISLAQEISDDKSIAVEVNANNREQALINSIKNRSEELIEILIKKLKW